MIIEIARDFVKQGDLEDELDGLSELASENDGIRSSTAFVDWSVRSSLNLLPRKADIQPPAPDCLHPLML